MSRQSVTTATPHAVLVGLDTLQGLQSARILARRGIPVIALARDRDHPACRTRVCQTILYRETAGEALISELHRLGPALPRRSVLYPCHDHAVEAISRHRDALADWYHVMLPAAATVDLLMDKASLYDFASRQGLRVPDTLPIRDRADAARAATAIRFPCILKPSLRSTTWNARTGAKVFHVASPGELMDTWERVRDWTSVMMAQEWIAGGDGELYTLNCYFDRRGELVADFVTRKLRQWPPRAGSGCLGEEARNDAMRGQALRLLRACEYRGLGYVEMKRDARNGEHYLMEVNVGRPTGRSAIAEAGGVELLKAMYCDALDLPLPARREQSHEGLKWLHLRHDMQAALHYWRRGELTLAEWRESLRGPKAHAIFSWQDPLPFLWDFWRAGRVAFARSRGPAL